MYVCAYVCMFGCSRTIVVSFLFFLTHWGKRWRSKIGQMGKTYGEEGIREMVYLLATHLKLKTGVSRVRKSENLAETLAFAEVIKRRAGSWANLMTLPLGKGEPHQWSVALGSEVLTPQGSISLDSGEGGCCSLGWPPRGLIHPSRVSVSGKGWFICSRSKLYCSNSSQVSQGFGSLSPGS